MKKMSFRNLASIDEKSQKNLVLSIKILNLGMTKRPFHMKKKFKSVFKVFC
jgi:hypothetical protein